jgi:nucleoside-diphosphate-sugar epimerase
MVTHRTKVHENDVLNVGSDVEMSILDLAKTVLRVVGGKARIEYLPALPEGDMSRRCPDTARMRQLLDRPLVPLEEGIDRLVKHFAANPK